MAEQRHAYRVGNSVVVALPKRVREHLGVEVGEQLYWYTTRPQEAVVTKRAQRTGGHPEGLALQRQLDAARAEIEVLRRKLAGRDQRVLHEGKSVGWAEASRYYAKLEGDIAAVRELVQSIAARLPFRRRPRARALAAQVEPAPASHAEAERDPPYADDFDGEGRVVPRQVERVELPPPPASEAAP
jgi:antitoxin component of MazEF toxin-antitoxin module